MVDDGPAPAGLRIAYFGTPAFAVPTLEALLHQAVTGEGRVELGLVGTGTQEIPAVLSASIIQDSGQRVYCLVATDLRVPPID